jgi:hypothetical protein
MYAGLLLAYLTGPSSKGIHRNPSGSGWCAVRSISSVIDGSAVRPVALRTSTRQRNTTVNKYTYGDTLLWLSTLPDGRGVVPAPPEIIDKLVEDGYIMREGDTLALTAAGKVWLDERMKV